MYCKSCGYRAPVRWPLYRLAGIGIAAFGVFGWFSFLFAGSGHAFFIACAITAVGLITAYDAENFASKMMEDKTCPKCGNKGFQDMPPENTAAELNAAVLNALNNFRITPRSDAPPEAPKPAAPSPPVPRPREDAHRSNMSGETYWSELKHLITFRDARGVNAKLNDPFFKNNSEMGKKALDYAIGEARRHPASNADNLYHIIESLIERGARMDISDIDFMECLSPEKRDFRLASILAKKLVDMTGRNLLHDELATDCRPDVVRFMIEHGADVNHPYKGYGAPPLRVAMSNDIPWVARDALLSVMQLLLDKGADVDEVGMIFQELYDFQKFDFMRLALANDIDVEHVNKLIVKNDLDPMNPMFDIDLAFWAYKWEKESEDGQTDELPFDFMTAGWPMLNNVPFYHFYWYIPQRYSGLTEESEKIRKMIYDFKDGRDYALIKSLLKIKLLSAFGPRLRDYVFLCIPASTKEKSDLRWVRFSEEICEELGMKNGYPHVKFLKEKTPAHLGGTDKAELELDGEFFLFENVILFDDVVTRGRSMQDFMDKLIEHGSTVVAQMSIGRTYNHLYRHDEPIHPLTENEAFATPGNHDPFKDVPF